MIDFLIGAAQAADGAQPTTEQNMMSILMLVVLFAVFYFLLIRPQQKRVKEHKAMTETLKKGDKVITTGGIHGKIISLEATTAIIESESYKLKIERSAISSELSAPLNKVAHTELHACSNDEVIHLFLL